MPLSIFETFEVSMDAIMLSFQHMYSLNLPNDISDEVVRLLLMTFLTLDLLGR